MVEIEFSIGKNQYKIIRGIKPNKFVVYSNGEPWDEDAKAVDQQKNLEQNVLKMNFKSFTQIVVLGSSTFIPFMRLPGTQRREIIEDILDIQVFSVMNGKLKDKIRENREEIKDLDYQIHLLEEKIELQKNYMLELKKKAEAEIDKKREKIVEFLNEEKNHICPTCTQDLSDEFRDGMITSGQEKLDEMNVGYEELQSAIKDEEERNEKFVTLSLEVNELNTTVSQTNFQLMTIRKQVDSLEEEIKEL